MAILPCELITRLNNLNGVSDLQFGTELQKCFDAITGGQPGNTVLSVYASQLAYEAANTPQDGAFFVNSSTQSLNYYINNAWVDVDLSSIQAQVTANQTQISLNAADIATVAGNLAAHILLFNGHNHNGINSPKIEIAGQLLTGSLPGQFLVADASGQVSLATIDTSLEVHSLGVLIEANTGVIDFDDSVFVVSSTSGNVNVSLPSLSLAITDIASNEAGILSNTTAISALNTSVSNNTANVAANTTNIATNTASILSHNHDGLNSPKLDPEVSLLPDALATTGHLLVVTATGVGYVDPASIGGGGSITGANSIGSTAATDIFKQVTSNVIEVRKIKGECGIVAALEPIDDHITVSLDFAGMANAGTALDSTNDTIIVHDASANTCVKTSLDSLLSALQIIEYEAGDLIEFEQPINGTDPVKINLDLAAMSNFKTLAQADVMDDFLVMVDTNGDTNGIYIEELLQTYNAGKGLSATTQPNGSITYDLDLTTINAGFTAPQVLDPVNDELLIRDNSSGDCVRMKVEDVLSNGPGGSIMEWMSIQIGSNTTLDHNETIVTVPGLKAGYYAADLNVRVIGSAIVSSKTDVVSLDLRQTLNTSVSLMPNEKPLFHPVTGAANQGNRYKRFFFQNIFGGAIDFDLVFQLVDQAGNVSLAGGDLRIYRLVDPVTAWS